MATLVKVRRLANPFRKSRRKNARSRVRRRLTRKQLKYFGTKRQKAAVKRHRRRVVAKATVNPRKRRRKVTVRRKRRNPALVVTLGALNPRKRRKTSMARTKHRRRRAHNRRTVVHHRRRRRSVVATANPIHHRRRRRVHNPRRRRVVIHRRHNRRRNPELFGSRAFSAEGLKMVAGGLLGVAAAKYIPKLIPTTLTSTLGNFSAVVLTGISAWLAGFLVGKWDKKIGDAVLFGGLMQTGSVALTMVAPGLSIGGVPIALSGLGDLLPGQFVVPQNPLRIPAPPMPSAKANVTMSGLARAFGPAF